jgi:predicted acylesterase/phospholipase RssA
VAGNNATVPTATALLLIHGVQVRPAPLLNEWRRFQALRREFAALRGAPGLHTMLKALKFKKKWWGELSRAAERRGFFHTEGFEAWLNDALAKRLGLHGGNVTFGRLYEETGKILKLVAVDVEKQELIVYSRQDSEDSFLRAILDSDR